MNHFITSKSKLSQHQLIAQDMLRHQFAYMFDQNIPIDANQYSFNTKSGTSTKFIARKTYAVFDDSKIYVQAPIDFFLIVFFTCSPIKRYSSDCTNISLKNALHTTAFPQQALMLLSDIFDISFSNYYHSVQGTTPVELHSKLVQPIKHLLRNAINH